MASRLRTVKGCIFAYLVVLRLCRHLVSCLFILSAGLLAQSPEPQIVNDAADALGGRDRVLALKTLLVEGAGHDMNVGQSLRFDELGLQSDVGQLRDVKRAYDLQNGRARFEQTREAQYPFYQGEGGARAVQALDGNVAFNVAPNGNATRVFGRPRRGGWITSATR